MPGAYDESKHHRKANGEFATADEQGAAVLHDVQDALGRGDADAARRVADSVSDNVAKTQAGQQALAAAYGEILSVARDNGGEGHERDNYDPLRDADPRTFSTRDDAIEQSILPALYSGVTTPDDFDVDAIAADVLVSEPDGHGGMSYYQDPNIDTDKFWEIVQSHDISPDVDNDDDADDDANNAWKQLHPTGTLTKLTTIDTSYELDINGELDGLTDKQRELMNAESSRFYMSALNKRLEKYGVEVLGNGEVITDVGNPRQDDALESLDYDIIASPTPKLSDAVDIAIAIGEESIQDKWIDINDRMSQVRSLLKDDDLAIVEAEPRIRLSDVKGPFEDGHSEAYASLEAQCEDAGGNVQWTDLSNYSDDAQELITINSRKDFEGHGVWDSAAEKLASRFGYDKGDVDVESTL